MDLSKMATHIIEACSQKYEGRLKKLNWCFSLETKPEKLERFTSVFRLSDKEMRAIYDYNIIPEHVFVVFENVLCKLEDYDKEFGGVYYVSNEIFTPFSSVSCHNHRSDVPMKELPPLIFIEINRKEMRTIYEFEYIVIKKGGDS